MKPESARSKQSARATKSCFRCETNANDGIASHCFSAERGRNMERITRQLELISEHLSIAERGTIFHRPICDARAIAKRLPPRFSLINGNYCANKFNVYWATTKVKPESKQHGDGSDAMRDAHVTFRPLAHSTGPNGFVFVEYFLLLFLVVIVRYRLRARRRTPGSFSPGTLRSRMETMKRITEPSKTKVVRSRHQSWLSTWSSFALCLTSSNGPNWMKLHSHLRWRTENLVNKTAIDFIEINQLSRSAFICNV